MKPFLKAALKVLRGSISLVTAQGKLTLPQKETYNDKLFSTLVFFGT